MMSVKALTFRVFPRFRHYRRNEDWKALAREVTAPLLVDLIVLCSIECTLLCHSITRTIKRALFTGLAHATDGGTAGGDMKYERSEQYKGYQISGNASPCSLRWQSLLTVARATYRTEAIGVVPLCDSAQAAVDQALRTARLMIDTSGFSLRTLDRNECAVLSEVQ